MSIKDTCMSRGSYNQNGLNRYCSEDFPLGSHAI